MLISRGVRCAPFAGSLASSFPLHHHITTYPNLKASHISLSSTLTSSIQSFASSRADLCIQTRTSRPAMSGYRFTPLEEADAIRLLILNPSNDVAAPLSGSIITTTLWECETNMDLANGYLALSYVWGNPARTASIQLNGFDVGITVSLEEALREIRNLSSGCTQRIWADDICINQSDTPEKNRQVPLMGNIYAHAKSTIIYLGSLTANLRALFEIARDNALRAATTDSEGKLRVLSSKWRDLGGRRVDHTTIKEKPPPDAIQELLQFPWFSRVWVNQELFLSRDPWVQCASLRVRWRVLCALVIPILDESEGPGATALQQMHSTYLHSEGQTLYEILRSRNGCRATDPRDMIFAYMGMHSDREEVAEFVTVDYDITLKQLLISTARYIHEWYGLYYLLDCIQRPVNSTWVDLPSWVPDWGITEWPEPNPLRRLPGCSRERCCISGHAEQLNLREIDLHTRNFHYIRIRYLSPVLPAPDEFFLPGCFYSCGARAGFYAKEEEALEYIQNLEISSTKGGSSERLFPKEFWATDNMAPARVARRILYKFYYGDMFENYRRNSKQLQNLRLAITYGGGVIAVPGRVMVGDMIATFNHRVEDVTCVYSCILRQVACAEVEASMGLFKVIWNDGGHEVCPNNFTSRHPDSLYKGPITLC